MHNPFKGFREKSNARATMGTVTIAAAIGGLVLGTVFYWGTADLPGFTSWARVTFAFCGAAAGALAGAAVEWPASRTVRPLIGSGISFMAGAVIGFWAATAYQRHYYPEPDPVHFDIGAVWLGVWLVAWIAGSTTSWILSRR
jgi:hypothetical protein